MRWIQDDGGRSAAGYSGNTQDCVCRAIAIATERPYQEIYDLIIEFSGNERKSKNRKAKSHPRTGVHKNTVRKLMMHLGWKWVPTMFVGKGCHVHLCKEELPKGRLVVSLSRHECAIINGIIYDTHDPSREGNRCVYGYYVKKEKHDLER